MEKVSTDGSIYLNKIPSSKMYYRSYMHRSTIDFTVSIKKMNFFVTISDDGIIKFWHRIDDELEFVYEHKFDSKIYSFTLSKDEEYLAFGTFSSKILLFKVKTFEIISVFSLKSTNPVCVTFIDIEQTLDPYIAYSYDDVGEINVFNPLQDTEIEEVTLSDGRTKKLIIPVNTYTIKSVFKDKLIDLGWSSDYKFIISVSEKGYIEFWTYKQDISNIKWTIQKFNYDSYFSTDYIKIINIECGNKRKVQSFDISDDSKYIAICCSDWKIRLYNMFDGKEVALFYDDLTMDIDNENEEYFKNRLILERNVRQLNSFYSICFSTYFLFVPSIFGIKIYKLGNFSNPIDILGKVEKGERYNTVTFLPPVDNFPPTLVCTAFEKNRFYLFNNSSPTSKRDVNNEKNIEKIKIKKVKQRITTDKRLPTLALLHTTKGTIKIRLYPKKCPLACENFVLLAKKGYYDGCKIFRVVRDFCIQMGDPTCTGNSGESIWGDNFEDEFDSELTFDKPYMVGMANMGPNTNGSQFFITTAVASHLNNKHTVFGEVVDGFNNIKNIEIVEVNNYSRPNIDILLQNITFSIE